MACQVQGHQGAPQGGDEEEDGIELCTLKYNLTYCCSIQDERRLVYVDHTSMENRLTRQKKSHYSLLTASK